MNINLKLSNYMGKMSRIYRLMSIAFALIFVNCTNAEEAAAAPSGSGDSKPEVPVLPETVKILAIGNSFSADAVEQELYGLFEAVGQKVVIGNMYIGGCPLETHAANAASDAGGLQLS